METTAVSRGRRGRKRRQKEAQMPVSGPSAKKQVVGRRGMMLFVGRYVKKHFEGSGDFLGKIVSYETGLFRVDYEDGDCEDLDGEEVKEFLVEDGDLEDKGWTSRKSKLDELIAKKSVKPVESTTDDVKTTKESFLTEMGNGGAQEVDAIEDDDKDLKAEVNAVMIPPPQLPPSSGNIGVPDEYVSCLLSVYGFLRSYSIQLFLSPFSLDDFVGSLNHSLQNALLDAVHIALLRLLKRHLEMLACDGSELASKCIRLTDWSLVDTLTWPIYLVQYLMIMGHIKGPQWRGFYMDALERSYYSLPSGRKLMILQLLCDDVLESVELRSELDIREEAEHGIDPEFVAASASEKGPDMVHPRFSKTAACKNQEQAPKTYYNSSVKGPSSNRGGDFVDDSNVDECRLCGMDGTLLCCDGCPSAYHSRCIGISKSSIPEGTWYCPECAICKAGFTVARGTSLTGAKHFGIDPYGHIYFGTCDHLLVLEYSTKSEQCFRYYHQNDIPKVLEALLTSAQQVMLYSDICKAIIQYWDIQKDVLAFLAKVKLVEESAVVKDNSQCTPMNMLGGGSQQKVYGNQKLEGLMTETGSENVVDTCSEKPSNGLLDIFFQGKDAQIVVSEVNPKSSDVCFYKGLNFKPQAYVNNYIQGDFAASAAASLAVLSSEEKGVSESHAGDKRRKTALADNLLQSKAFSSVAVRFFWPIIEKKLVEAPRERCSWCQTCKSTVSCKRACLLNVAASNATKGAMKILSRLPAVMNGEESLRPIATYIIFMEESLCGLVVGSFGNAAYRNQWRKRVEQAASTLEALKSLLLELEKNIRAIALSVDWFKLVDSWLVESSVAQSSAIVTGSTQKRGLRGRRGRKPAVVSEPADDEEADSSNDLTWWRKGMFSKLILLRGVLPHSLVKRAARRGGYGMIPEIVYAEGSEIAKRSRQYCWRAAVEMSKSASELALQVRRLDNYVRWNDLVRPEQTVQDGKGQETEASAYRNAFVCDKKNVENKIRYGVVFRSQKHLPSRVMKNIIEVERSQDGKEKYWFSESNVPLYLIKEYEEKVDKKNFPLPDKPAYSFANLQKRQLKACRKDIFSYLSCKGDNLVKCSCASCRVDIMLRDAVKCNECEGFCHERCTIGSTNHRDGKVERWFTCKLCHTKGLPQSENESPNSPLLLQGKNSQDVVTPHEGSKDTSNHRSLAAVGDPNSSLKLKLVVKNSGSVLKKGKKIASWGIIYKKDKDGKSKEEKAKEDEDGIRFRMRNILVNGNSNIISRPPRCHLCDQPYDPALMYILCDTCEKWYHTDALELEESKFSDVVGFKCCKCRRFRSPICPYSDSNKGKALPSKKLSARGTKRSNSEYNNPNPAIPDVSMEMESTPIFSSPPLEEVPCISGDDPLLYSSSMVEQFPEPNSGVDTQLNTVTSASRTGPQKLPVRRLTNNNKITNSSAETQQGNISDQVQDYSLPPCAEWDVSGNGFENDVSLDCNDFNFEDMDFEPQTYFSFNELLSPDDMGQVDETNAYLNVDLVAPNDSGQVDQANTYLNDELLVPSDMGQVDETDTYLNDFGNNYGDLQNGFAGDLLMVDGQTMGQEPNNISAEFCGDAIFCQGCYLGDPSPDLGCQNCGLYYHSYCSPWVVEYTLGGQWICGKCREWH